MFTGANGFSVACAGGCGDKSKSIKLGATAPESPEALTGAADKVDGGTAAPGCLRG